MNKWPLGCTATVDALAVEGEGLGRPAEDGARRSLPPLYAPKLLEEGFSEAWERPPSGSDVAFRGEATAAGSADEGFEDEAAPRHEAGQGEIDKVRHHRLRLMTADARDHRASHQQHQTDSSQRHQDRRDVERGR